MSKDFAIGYRTRSQPVCTPSCPGHQHPARFLFLRGFAFAVNEHAANKIICSSFLGFDQNISEASGVCWWQARRRIATPTHSYTSCEPAKAVGSRCPLPTAQPPPPPPPLAPNTILAGFPIPTHVKRCYNVPIAAR